MRYVEELNHLSRDPGGSGLEHVDNAVDSGGESGQSGPCQNGPDIRGDTRTVRGRVRVAAKESAKTAPQSTCAQIEPWTLSHKYDPDGARLADGHYSRRTPGSPQFMPPGETIVLVTACKTAVWGWWRPHPASGISAMNGLDGWTCSIFRNTGPLRSSDLVLAAERALLVVPTAAPCGPDGMLTYVWPRKIRSTNPGYCFQVAGWTRAEWTTGRGPSRAKRLLRKPIALAGASPSSGVA